ncbi:DUF167 domain-containing protein [Sphingomonas sp. HDW15A]|uniref:DUF167 domain-containing protein n=1 Tax=Sphingomonas sp. HDW15A TaxID=2714942 RepID=UPI00140C6EE9|nr:DUF167 domain-containing protein [Sphingomonas sp. HDW15A]QIK95800.1 DUF167 domain-containing protein [Sphingomonas sp. HDW15A]
MAKRKLPLPEAAEVRERVDAKELIEVRVTPNASADQVTLPEGNTKVLTIRTTASPEHGKANEAVLRLLARVLDLPVSSLALVRGATSRNKLVKIVEGP